MSEEFIFAAFRSRQHVLDFEDKLNAAGIMTHIINTPHGLAQGCGLSVRIDMEDYERARRILESYDAHSFVGFYKATVTGGKVQYSPVMKRR